MPQPLRQDLSKASGGTITGRGGRVQQLGKAAMRRMPTPAPAPKLAWQQLAEQGIAGQGSAAANKAKLASLAPPVGTTVTTMGDDGADPRLNRPPTDMIAKRIPGGPTDMGIARRIPPDPNGEMRVGGRGGMASYLPGRRGDVTDFMDRGAQPPPGMPVPPGATWKPDPSMADTGGGMFVGPDGQPVGYDGRPVGSFGDGAGPLPGGGVDSNAFAANGGTPSGAPLPQAQPGAGQGARIAALIARLRGGGAGLQPRMA